MTANDLRPYPEYKDSGIAWLGEIPAHWDVTRLKSSVSSINNQTSEKRNDERYIALEHIESWTGRITLREDVAFESQVKRFQPDDVLFGKLRPYLAKVAQPDFHGVCVSEFLVLRVRSGKIMPSYLKEILQSKPVIGVINSSTFGAKMPRADWNFIGNLILPIPSLPEQFAITHYLNYIDSLTRRYIRAKRRLIELLTEQKQAIIQQAVTRGLDPNVHLKPSGIEWLGEIPEHWRITKLMHLASKIGDGLHGTPQYVDESEYHFINGNNLSNGSISITDSARCVSRDEYEKYRLQMDDSTLLVSINGTIGNSAYYQNEKVILSKSVAYINCSGKILKQFLYYLLQSSSIKNYFYTEATGTTILNLSLKSVRNTPITLPSLNEQSAIVSFLSTETKVFDAMIGKTQREIDLIREYRTRLIADVISSRPTANTRSLERGNTAS